MEQGEFRRIGRDLSILDRLMKMYYERGLTEFEIGWGQQFYVEFIADNPGATPQSMSDFFQVDKGTVTKLIKKLVEIRYISVEVDPSDRRVRHLFLTEKAGPAVETIKRLHQKFYEDLTAGMETETVGEMEGHLEEMIRNMNRKVRHRADEDEC